MGKFDDRGKCFTHSFEKYLKRYPAKKDGIREKTLTILNDNLEYMIYLWKECPENPQLINMFLGGNGLLGLELAIILRESTRDKRKLIRVHDIDQRIQMPLKVCLYTDKRYVVGLKNMGDYYADISIIDMYIYKK